PPRTDRRPDPAPRPGSRTANSNRIARPRSHSWRALRRPALADHLQLPLHRPRAAIKAPCNLLVAVPLQLQQGDLGRSLRGLDLKPRRGLGVAGVNLGDRWVLRLLDRQLRDRGPWDVPGANSWVGRTGPTQQSSSRLKTRLTVRSPRLRMEGLGGIDGLALGSGV